MDDLAVEIRRNNGIFLKASVVDIQNEEVVVILDNGLKSERTYPFEEVRVAIQPNIKPESYPEGDHVEVCKLIEEEENTFGWMPGRVQLVKGDFVVVAFGSASQDIFPSEKVRKISKSASITATTFHKHTIKVPSDLITLCQDMNSHNEFKHACGASIVKYSPALTSLVILSSNESIIKKAVLLGDMHLRSLRQKSALIQMMKDATKRLEQNTRHHPQAAFQEDFLVSKDLMGLAIGTHGNNIQQAKQVQGIKAIELDEVTGTFSVYGDTQQAVNQARAILEFKQETILLPKHLISRVIGKNGHHIQDIVDKSGVVRVKIKGEEYNHSSPQSTPEDQNSNVPFIFIGTVESIENAKLLLDYHIMHLKEVEQLTQQKLQLDVELRNLSLTHRDYFVPPRYAKESESDHEEHLRRGGGRGGMNNKPSFRGEPRGGGQQPPGRWQPWNNGRANYQGSHYPRSNGPDYSELPQKLSFNNGDIGHPTHTPYRGRQAYNGPSFNKSAGRLDDGLRQENGLSVAINGKNN